MIRAAAMALTTLLMAGCFNLATKSSEISAAYVPSSQYASYDCPQLSIELQNLARHKNDLTAAQESRRKSSKLQAFWLGFGNGDGVEAPELANIKGQIFAVQKQSDLKGCMEAGTSIASANTPTIPAARGAATSRRVDYTDTVVAAQKLSTGMGCGDVKAAGGSTFRAKCPDYTVVIACDGAACHPTHTAENP